MLMGFARESAEGFFLFFERKRGRYENSKASVFVNFHLFGYKKRIWISNLRSVHRELTNYFIFGSYFGAKCSFNIKFIISFV